MGLTTIQTKVSIQGYISGAVNLDAGFVQKFDKGGISNGSNGILNSSILIPQAKEIGSKNQVLYDSNISSTSKNKKTTQSADSSDQAKTNNSFAINSKMPEPLAIFSFKKDDVQNLLAASYQAYLEDKCSLSFSENLLKLIQQNNSQTFEPLLKSIKSEILAVQNTVDAISSVETQSGLYDSSISSRHSGAIKEICKTNFYQLSPDVVGPIDEITKDPHGILEQVANNASVLSEKTQTSLVSQVLQLCAQTLTNGCTPYVLNEKIYDIAPGKNSVSAKNIRELQEGFPTLSLISLKNEPNQTFLYSVNNVKETQTYIKRLGIDKLSQVSEIRKSAYYATMLANEFAISAGLGRLDGTELGQAFNSTGDYIQSFLGVRGLIDSTIETTSPDSLVDFLVVSEDGTNRVEGSRGVLLLDGSNFESTLTRKNSFDAFVRNIIRDPTNNKKNKIQALENGLVSSLSRYNSGFEFYKKLHLRDQKLKLLTPRGLFSRILKDFSDSLESLKSEDVGQKQIARELAIISLISRQSLNDTSDSSPANLLKRYLVKKMALKAFFAIYAKEGVNQKSTDAEVIKNLVKVFGDDQGKSILNEKKIRFSASDTELLTERFSTDFEQKTVASLCALDCDAIDDGPYIQFSSVSFFEKVFENENGFLEKLVQIFIDLHGEADKVCKQDNQNNSFVDSLRLTKNSQLDGTLAMSMIFEIACSFCGLFVKATKPLTLVNGANFSSSNAFLQGKISESFDATRAKVIQLKISAGFDEQISITQKALAAVAGASLSNDLDSLIVYNNQGAVVPELDNKPINYPISFDKTSDLSVGTLINVMKDLSFERDIPAACISSAKASFEFVRDSSKKIISTGKQLLGLEQQDDKTKALVDFAKTQIGKSYLASINDFDLSAAIFKIAELNKALQAMPGRNPKITLSIFECLQSVLPELMSNKSSAFFVVNALPTDFVKDSLHKSYSIKKDVQNSLQDAIMVMSLQKNSLFSNETYQNVYKEFFVRNLLADDSFSALSQSSKVSLAQICAGTKFSNLGTGIEILQNKTEQERAFVILQNEVVSYLLSKMFSVLSSADLFQQNISSNFSEYRSNSSQNLARIFAKAYGLPESTFDSVFLNDPQFGTILSKEALLDLATDKFQDGSSSIIVKHAPISFGEAELFYDIFSTVYFFEGQIANLVFSSSILDRTVGAICSLDDFLLASTSDSIKMLGNKLVTNSANQQIQQSNSSAGNPDSFSFDTYSVEFISSNPLVNS